MAAPVVAAALVYAVLFAAPRLADTVVNGQWPEAQQPPPVSDAARALHARSAVVDLHADPLMWSYRDFMLRGQAGHVDLPRLLAGNVAVQGFGVVTKVPVTQNFDSNSNTTFDVITVVAALQGWGMDAVGSLLKRSVFQARRLHALADASAGALSVLHDAADLDTFLERRASDPQMVAGYLGVEGLHCIGEDIGALDTLFEEGVRMAGVAHFFDNALAGSAHGEEKYGLTELGRRAVERMEELHMIVDLAHASTAVVDDVLAMATRPLVVSHTGVKATCDNVRNLADHHLRTIADKGGLVGIAFFKQATCGSGAADIVAAILHAAEVMGAQHVALGSDWDGGVRVPLDASQVAVITSLLLEAGMSEADVQGVIGGNAIAFLRRALP